MAGVGACGYAVARCWLARGRERRTETKHVERALEVLEGEGGIVLS